MFFRKKTNLNQSLTRECAAALVTYLELPNYILNENKIERLIWIIENTTKNRDLLTKAIAVLETLGTRECPAELMKLQALEVQELSSFSTEIS